MIPTAPPTKENPNPKHIDPEWIRQELTRVDAITGEKPELEPGVTLDEAIKRLQESIRQDMLSRGIDPESIRYEQKYEGE